jgi:menaquinone-specific isochorismate synthase
MNLPLLPISSPLSPMPASLATAKSFMLEQLYEWLGADEMAAHGPQRIVRLEIPLADCSPLQWLRWQDHSVRFYWSDRRQELQVAGIGVADLLRAEAHGDYAGLLAQRLPHGQEASGKARYFGGIRFDPYSQSDARWECYGGCFFVLPRFEVIREGGVTTFACNLIAGAGASRSSIGDELARVRTTGERGAAQPARPVRRRDNPDKGQWLRNVEAALGRVATGEIAKVVLSRRTTLSFETPPDPLALLEKLQTIEPRAYHFCFQPQAQCAFLGATPERLYQRRGRTICSEAVAGTCVRGGTPWEDRRLGEALLYSDKEYREHKLVSDAILAALDPLCLSLEASVEPSLLKQSKVQHLYSFINGRLRERIGDSDVLKALHPTPAVGGFPKNAARRAIAELEPFDRGWFAGPVGWIGADAAEFAVGIRSAMLHGPSLSLFAGAGVVPGSLPELEWEEMESKISVFMAALEAP